MGLFVDVPTPFFEEFLDKIKSLSYPKAKIDLFVYIGVPYHEKMMENFIAQHGRKYASVKLVLPRDNVAESEARHLAM